MGTSNMLFKDTREIEKITHSRLVGLSSYWVANKFEVVVTEKSSGFEIPDVVGLSLSRSILVECKVSRADFYADKRKYTRRRYESMLGNYRVYCAPKDMLKEEELPEGWGLLEVYPSSYIRLNTNIFKNYSKYFHPLHEHGYKQERHLLFTALRDRNREGNKILLNFKA